MKLPYTLVSSNTRERGQCVKGGNKDAKRELYKLEKI